MLSIVIPVYKPGIQESLAITQLVENLLQADAQIELVIVNDSPSEIDSDYLSATSRYNNTVLVNHTNNRGRASAINTGVMKASSPVIWVLDADCLVDLAAIHQALSFDSHRWDMEVGRVTNPNENEFWSRYQQASRNSDNTVTSANLLISTELFKLVGGFDEGYIHYGFEDKDFFQRIPESTRINQNSSLEVVHFGEVTLDTIRKKFYDAARSGERYSNRFQEAYLSSPYARADARIISGSSYGLMAMAELVDRVFFPVTRFLVEMTYLPYMAKSTLVKFTLAAAYFRGSRKLDT